MVSLDVLPEFSGRIGIFCIFRGKTKPHLKNFVHFDEAAETLLKADNFLGLQKGGVNQKRKIHCRGI